MSDAIPILFTLGGARHEIVLISPTKATLEGLKDEIVSLIKESPNCTQIMAKYGKGEDEIATITAKWSAQSHDPKIYPASTVITEKNFEAVLKMIGASGVGRDTLEVKFGKEEETKK
jgi:hypothetical protein